MLLYDWVKQIPEPCGSEMLALYHEMAERKTLEAKYHKTICFTCSKFPYRLYLCKDAESFRYHAHNMLRVVRHEVIHSIFNELTPPEEMNIVLQRESQ